MVTRKENYGDNFKIFLIAFLDNTILGATGLTLSSTLLMKGIPAVGAGIGASFGIG